MEKGEKRYEEIVVDEKKGKKILQENEDEKRYKEQMKKMMKIYMMFEEIKEGRIKKDKRIKVQEYEE